MGVILDILKDIPLTAVLEERLRQTEAKMAVLETENAALKAENAELKTKLQQIESDKAVQGDKCPYCQKPMGKLLDIKPHKIFGEVGVKVHYYQCQNKDCGKTYDKEMGTG